MKREIIIGAFLLIAIVLFIGGILWLSGRDIFGRDKIIKAHFTDAEGVEPGLYVYLRGVKVGEVKRVYIIEDGVAVEFSVPRTLFIPEDSKVEAKTAGLLEEKFLSLIPGKLPTPLPKERMLEGRKQLNIMEAWEKLDINELAAFLKELRALIGDNKAMMENTQKILARLSLRLDEISVIARSEIKETRQELKELALTLKTLTETFQGGALGKFIQDTLFYSRLTSTIVRFDSLIEKLKKEPIRVRLF